MLDRDPTRRISIKEILNHNWIKKNLAIKENENNNKEQNLNIVIKNMSGLDNK